MRRLSNPSAYVVRAHPLDPSPEQVKVYHKTPHGGGTVSDSTPRIGT